MANGEGFALVYSITSSLSFAEVEKIRSGIIKHKNTSQVPLVLVGNKKDLEAKREVMLLKPRSQLMSGPYQQGKDGCERMGMRFPGVICKDRH